MNGKTVTVVLPETTDCDATGAICTSDGRMLTGELTAIVPAASTTDPPDTETDGLTVSYVEGHEPPAEHDGKTAFTIKFAFSEALYDYGFKAMRDTSLKIYQGATRLGSSNVSVSRTAGVAKNKGWSVTVTPSTKEDIAIDLGPTSACTDSGAMCDADGRALSNALPATTVQGPPGLSVADATVEEAAGASVDFTVSLSRAASETVTVNYTTSDDSATAGSDYTSTSGTLTFSAGDTAKTVSVPVRNDDHDEGSETLVLTLSNVSGGNAYLADATATGTISNTDPLQQDWLARFGRAAASDAVAAVTARLETPRDAGSHLTLAGQRMDLSDTDGSAALVQVLTGFASLLGASPEAADPAGTEPPVRWLSTVGPPDRRDVQARTITGRELLMRTSFRAVLGGGAGSQWTSWGQGASVSAFSSATPSLSLSGETATGSLGMDYERGRLLTGFAMTHSLGEGTAQGAGRSYVMGSSVTTALPYARLALSDRLSAWGLAGTGSGRLTLDLDGDTPERYGADPIAALRGR